MLSRVAESLYWMARYIERGEAVARLAAVDFQALLDGTRRGRLEDVVRITSDAVLFRSIFPAGDEAGVLEFLHAHPANPSGVLVCLARARENARGMREQISSEMWEHLNRLYLLARDGRAAAMAEGPYAFFRQVRDGSQAFEGITAATMTHAPAYEFIQLGRYLERAVITIRTLAVRYEDVCMLEDGSAPASLELITLLKSCGAFEPFRRSFGAISSSGTSSSSLPSPSTYTNSYSCRFDFASRRFCFLDGIPDQRSSPPTTSRVTRSPPRW